MTLAQLRENEVLLGGYRLPIIGPVQRVKATTYASKVTVGPTKRSSQTLADEWVQNQWRAGALIKLFDDSEHQERFWFGDADTTRKLKMILPPLIQDYGSPAGEANQIDLLIEYQSKVYCSFGGNIYTWDPVNLWSVKLHSLGTAPQQARVYKGDLYWFYTTGYTVYPGGTDATVFLQSGGTWQDNPNTIASNGVNSGYPTTTMSLVYAENYDTNPNEKLMALDSLGVLWATVDGLNWDDGVGGHIYDVVPTSLIAFRDAWDQPTLFIGTDHGLYSVDVWTKSVYPTSLRLAPTTGAGQGSCVWTDGSLYFPANLAIWRYPRSGEIVNIGFNKIEDDGLPTYLRGTVTQVLNTPSALVAVVDATTYAATLPDHTTLTGTVALTQGSATVTGTGTKFTSQVPPGSYVRFGSDPLVYTVPSAPVSDTSLTISPPTFPGTASVTNGSTAVTGVGTTWASLFTPGDVLTFGSDSHQATVSTVNSDTSLTLGTAYGGPTNSGLAVKAVGYLGATASGVSGVVDNEVLYDRESEWGASIFPQTARSGYSSLMEWNGQGWHCLYQSSFGTNRIRSVILSTIGAAGAGNRLLYFGDGYTLQSMEFPEGNYDPTQDSTYQYRPTAYFQSSWFLADQQEVPKMAASLRLGTQQLTASECIDVYYATDFVETWAYLGKASGWSVMTGRATLTNGLPNVLMDPPYTYEFLQLGSQVTFNNDPTTYTVGSLAENGLSFTLTAPYTGPSYNGTALVSYAGSNPVNSQGEISLPFNGRLGIRFNSIALKLVFRRDPNNTLVTPVLTFFDLHYKLKPPVLWGWTFTVDTSRIDHLEDVWQDLEDMAEEIQMYEFAYRSKDDPSYRYVDIVSIEGQESPGSLPQGNFRVTVVELDPPVTQ